MKAYILILFLLTFWYSLSQQSIYSMGQNIPLPIPKGFHIKDKNHILDKFVGTWQGQLNGKSLKVVLYPMPDAAIGDYFCDQVYGSYVYAENGVELVNTMPDTGDQSMIQWLWWGMSNDHQLVLKFYDPGRPKLSSKLTLTYSTSPPVERLHWSLSVVDIQSSYTNEPAPILTHRVPLEFDLVKQ